MKTDAIIQQNILDELAWDPQIDAAAIGVVVRDGVALLSGFVPHADAAKAAAEATQRIDGVRAVANEVQVRGHDHGQRTDLDIAEAAADMLDWNAVVPPRTIAVAAHDGQLTLSGSVAWQHQRRAAEQAVRHLNGVTGVTNTIVVNPPSDSRIAAADVTAQITVACEHTAPLAAKCITVETHDSTVFLWGVVQSWDAYRAAEHAAWAVPGVTHVENHICVDG